MRDGSEDRKVVARFAKVRAKNEDLTNVTEDNWRVKYMDLPLKSQYLKLGC